MKIQKTFSIIILQFTLLIILKLDCVAQKDTWKIMFPGYDYGTYKASNDASDNLHLALNGNTALIPNRFISLDKNGYVTYDSITAEMPLLHFADSNDNRYLVSWNSPTLRVQKFNSQNLLLWNTPLIVTNPVNGILDKHYFINAAQFLLTSNNKLIIAGNFKEDTVTTNFAVTAFIFDASTGAFTNFCYHPWIYYHPDQINLQEDSLSNVNLISYDKYDEEFYVDKFNQNGSLISSIRYGDRWNLTSIKDYVVVSKNCIYFGITDSTGYHIVGLDKNLDTLFVLTPGYYLDFGEFLFSDDSTFFISHDNGSSAGEFRRYDYYGNLICQDDSSSYYNLSYRMFMFQGKVFSVRDAFGVTNDSCSFTTCSEDLDPDSWSLMAGFLNDTRFGRDSYAGKKVCYLGCRTGGIFGVMGIIDSKPSDFSGNVYFDLNNNCLPDSGEPGLVNQMIQIAPVGKIMFTDQNGNYGQYIDTGSYSLTTHFIDTALSICPASISLQINDTSVLYANNNMAVQGPVESLMDLSVSVNQTATVPGQACYIFVNVMNHGPLAASGVVMLTIDSNTYSSLAYISPAADSVVSDKYYWHVTGLSLYSIARFYAEFMASNSIISGTVFSTTADVTNTTIENNLSDNHDVFNATVLSSFDPNDKHVIPVGTGINGYISPADSVLTYKIQFQNTGTYQAFDIKVIDTIDPSLDIATFRLLSASHSCQVSLLSDNILQFTFKNINLPDSATNEMLSHGFINYSIHTKPLLPLPTVIKNKAGIYFDFNAPVVTNETVNTIIPLGIEDKSIDTDFNLFPNPVSGQLSIITKNEFNPLNFSIIDITGRIILSGALKLSNNIANIDVSFLQKGCYFFKLSGKKSEQIKVFIKI